MRTGPDCYCSQEHGRSVTDAEDWQAIIIDHLGIGTPSDGIEHPLPFVGGHHVEHCHDDIFLDTFFPDQLAEIDQAPVAEEDLVGNITHIFDKSRCEAGREVIFLLDRFGNLIELNLLTGQGAGDRAGRLVLRPFELREPMRRKAEPRDITLLRVPGQQDLH